MNDVLNTPYVSSPVPFVPGVPVQIVGTIGTNMRIYCSTGGTPGACDSWTGSGAVDFANTAVLTGIQLLDPNGNPITDFSVTSESGAQFGPNGAVPEPSGLFLVAGGLACCSFLRWRLAGHSRKT